MLRQVDLHQAEPSWKPSKNPRYGAVLIDDQGRVLLREPKNHYGGYVWTFPKGGQDYAGEHPVDVAEREVLEETGYEGEIIGLVPGSFAGDTSTTYFFVMRPANYQQDKMDAETWNTRWVTPEEAVELIGQSTTDTGRARDLAILQSAVEEHRKIVSGQADYSSLFVDIKPQAQTEPQLAPPGGFPASVESLKRIKSLGGSTGAELMEDPQTGTQFVLKRGSHDEHIREEAAADAVYRAVGVKVPAFQVYETPSGPVKLSAYVSNARPLNQVMEKGTSEEKEKVKSQLQQHFAADALLGNWDVLGMDADNILVDEQGEVWRIDNGGSLRYRAQGEPKGAAWNEYPVELWTMRKRLPEETSGPMGARAQSVKYFGDLGYAEVGRQMRELAARRDAILTAAPQEVRETLGKRLDIMEHLGRTQEQMQAAKWNEGYQDEFGRNVLGYRQSGILGKAPARMIAEPNPYYSSGSGNVYSHILKDENGNDFGSLRSRMGQSIVYDLATHIEEKGGDYAVILDWLSQQSIDSFSKYSTAVKWLVAHEKGNLDDFWWGEGYNYSSVDEGIKNAEKNYQEFCDTHGGEEMVKRTFNMYHSFIHELLTTMDMPHKNPDGTIRLIRSESSSFINDVAKAKKGDKGISVPRGAADSMSLLNPVMHDHVTISNVPISDVLAVYMLERTPGSGGTCLFRDNENEFVVCIGRTPFDYIGTLSDYNG